MQASIEYIRHQPNLADLREALNSLSPDIKDLYMKALTQICSYEDGRTYLAIEVLKSGRGFLPVSRAFGTCGVGYCPIWFKVD